MVYNAFFNSLRVIATLPKELNEWEAEGGVQGDAKWGGKNAECAARSGIANETFADSHPE
jgi:hypothetical protein